MDEFRPWGFSWIPPSKICFLKMKMVIFLMKSCASPDILRSALQNYLLSKIVKLSKKQQRLRSHRRDHCASKKQTNPNKHWTAPWMEFLNAVLMLPLLSLWDQADFNKSCAFLSTFKFGCAGGSNGFYIKCLLHFGVNIFLISSCLTQCLIRLGLLPTGTWQ